MKITDRYVFFYSTKDPFSNWAATPFTYDGVLYNCSEQYMMLQKAMLFEDYDIAEQVMEAKTPDTQKGLGKLVSNFDADKWSAVNQELMVPALVAKFTSTPELKEFILATEDKILVEASPYDRIWGVGLGENDPKILSAKNWRGQNLLGIVLMRARDIIKEQDEAKG